MVTKSSLAIELSKLEVFDDPNIMDEQYPTEPEIAADMLWNAYMLGDIEGRRIVDLGAGTGILALGAVMLGGSVTAIEKDEKAFRILKRNMEGYDCSLLNIDAFEHSGSYDVVIMNPPFGTKQKHIDAKFLRKALKLGKIVYSFHKTSTKAFIQKIANVTHRFDYEFPLKRSYKHHKKRIRYIKVSAFRSIRSDVDVV